MSTKLGFLVEIEHASDIMKVKFKPEPDADKHANKLFTFVSKRSKLKIFSAGALREDFVTF